MRDARNVFERMPRKTAVSWTVLMSGYLEQGQAETVLELYQRMTYEGYRGNSRTFMAALKACGGLVVNEEGKVLEKVIGIHSDIDEAGLESDVFVATMLMNMYIRCGSMEDSCKVFEKMRSRDAVSWTTLMMGYVENGEEHVALELFSRMQDEGIRADSITFIAALKACSGLALNEEGELLKVSSLEKGRVIHSLVMDCGLDSDIRVSNSLVDMYAKCGSMVDCKRMFDSIESPTLASWTSLMQGYTESGEGEMALELFDEMECEPDGVMYVAALKACGNAAEREQGVESQGRFVKVRCLERAFGIHRRALESGCYRDVFFASMLIDVYSKCGSLEDARQVFDVTPDRDLVLWTLMVSGYVDNGLNELALELFNCMSFEPDSPSLVAAVNACIGVSTREEAKKVGEEYMKVESLERGMAIHARATESGSCSDIFVANRLMDMYVKCGSTTESRKVFDTMRCHNIVSWTLLLEGDPDVALQLLPAVPFQPDSKLYVAAVKLCGDHFAMKSIRGDVHRYGLQNEDILANSLLDMYCKSRSISTAQHVFDSLVERNLVAWNTLITGYSRERRAERVFDLVHAMEEKGLRPDAITFVCLIAVCSYAGMLPKGREIFRLMSSPKYGLTPNVEHYVCIVDMLGRANEIDEAMKVAKSMPMKPSVMIWRTLLGACRKWRNVEVGKYAYDMMLEMDQTDVSAYKLMSSIYGNTGMWEDQLMVEIARLKAEVK